MTHPKTSLATLIGVGVAAAVAVMLLGGPPKPKTRMERAWGTARRAPKRIADKVSEWW
jgi:hypothetical protein